MFLEMMIAAALTITEDDPRWDCATMGNLVCGPEYNPESAWAAWDDQEMSVDGMRVEYRAESMIPFLLLTLADADDILVSTSTHHYLFDVKDMK